MRISDWSSDVYSSDLAGGRRCGALRRLIGRQTRRGDELSQHSKRQLPLKANVYSSPRQSLCLSSDEVAGAGTMSHSNVGFCDHSNKAWPVRRRPRRRYNWPRDERPDTTLRRSAVKGSDVGDRSLSGISAPVMPPAFGGKTRNERNG